MRIGSLFSGYGGLDLAVAQVYGASVAWHVEFDKHPSAILDAHFPDVPNYGDVTAVDFSAVEPVDILTGGFPCQDLSHAGKRAGLRPGTRSGLWQHMAYAINELRPELVVIENVRGILSAAAHSDVEPCPLCVGDSSGDALRALGAVLGDLADIGYDAQWRGIRAADVGAPHGRFRVFVVAYPASGGRIGWPAQLSRASGHPAGDGSVAAYPANDGLARRWATRAGRAGLTHDGDESVALLPTPTAQDERDGTHLRNITKDAAQRGSKRGIGLNHLVEGVLDDGTPLLPTPAVNDMGAGKTPEQWDAWTAKMQAAHGNGNGHGNSLAIEALRLLGTPRAAMRERDDRDDHRNQLEGQITQLMSTPTAGLGEGGGQRSHRWRNDSQRTHNPVELARDMADGTLADFGPYAAAVARWEATLGRPAPAPTEPGGNGKLRLSPRFVEWMMGLPAGWVTDAGIPRNAQLKALGNGVVPQQAALALRLLGQVAV